MNPFYLTAQAAVDYDPEAERLHGPPSHHCQVYGPSGAELLITDYELEEFERDTHTPLVSDCPPARVWKRLLRWAHKNLKLKSV